jgi:hypothetical protein
VLVSALKDRGITVASAASVFMALARVCKLEAGARGADRGSGSAYALLFVFPERMRDAAELYRTAGQYAPSCRCWLYGPADRPELRAVTEGDVARWPVREARQPEVVVRPITPGPRLTAPAPLPAPSPAPVSRAPSLRLAGTERAVAAGGGGTGGSGGNGDGAAVGPQAPILTPEELRMLLGEEEQGR